LARWDKAEYTLPFAAVHETCFVLRACCYPEQLFFAFRAGEGEISLAVSGSVFPWFPAVGTLHIAGDQLCFILKHCPGQSSIPIV
jgi:hypothetical protein